jgi:mannose-1-phosphate guanylyltransferase/mannose-6-phosphate isomerase
MYGISKSDVLGNVLQGDVIAVETTNSMVRSTSRLVTVVGMKDVIVIDTPDALLVTRVGHCQSVKKVAEHLKGEHRIEAERHQPMPVVAAQVVAEPGPVGVTMLVQSDAMELATARISVGGSLHIEAEANRELIVSKGEIVVSTITSNTTLKAGERMMLETYLPAILVNASNAEVEVVLMMVHVPAAAWQSEPAKVITMAKSA